MNSTTVTQQMNPQCKSDKCTASRNNLTFILLCTFNLSFFPFTHTHTHNNNNTHRIENMLTFSKQFLSASYSSSFSLSMQKERGNELVYMATILDKELGYKATKFPESL